MFEALIEKVILSRLSEYIQDLDRNKLKVNLWSGKIVLENVKLNPKILLMLKVPLIFKHTKICKIDITIPWTSLSTKSVEINIQGIYCIMVPFQKSEWTFDIGMLVEKIKESLKNHELWWTIEKERKKLSEDANKQKSTYLEGLKESIIANLKVNLSEFHIRFEGTCRKSEFAVGMMIDSVACLPQDKDTNLLEVSNFSVYVNVQDGSYKDFEKDIARETQKDKIITLSTTIIVKKDNVNMSVSADVQNMNFLLTHLQYIYLIRFSRRFTKYNTFISQQIEQKKYLIFSPCIRTSHSLWIFAKQAIFALIRQKRSLSNVFVMASKTRSFYRDSFISLFEKCKKNTLTPDEEYLYNKILYLCEWEDLIFWQSKALEIHENQKKKERKWLGFFQSSAQEETPIIISSSYSQEQNAKNWKMTISCRSKAISLKLATYSLEKREIQSQLVKLSDCNIFITITEPCTSANASLGDMEVIYQDIDMKETILKLRKVSEEPVLKISFEFYVDIKSPNEISYISQEVDFKINLKSISHFVNFCSLRDLGIKKRKEIFDGLKHMQEKAMAQITDIFYYEKVYKLNINLPRTTVLIPSKNGIFYITLYNMHIIDSKGDSVAEYSALETGSEIEILFENFSIIPRFQVEVYIFSLSKKFLKLKWECKETPYDQLYDLNFRGHISNIQTNFIFALIPEFKYLQSVAQLHESRESLIMDKNSIMKNFEIMNTATLTENGTSQKCIAVLNDDAIFFFIGSSNASASDYITLTKCNIESCDMGIQISNYYRKIFLNFGKEVHNNKWLVALHKKNEEKTEEVKIKTMEKKIFGFEFVVESMSVVVFSDEEHKEYQVFVDKQEFFMESSRYVQHLQVKCAKILVRDRQDKQLFAFGTGSSEEKIVFKYISEESQEFKGYQIDVQGFMSTFAIYCDHTTLGTLIKSYYSLGSSAKKHDSGQSSNLKIQVAIEVRNFGLYFHKNKNERGKFFFDCFKARMAYDNKNMNLEGNLQNFELLWVEKSSNIFVPIFACNGDKSIKYSLKICENQTNVMVNVEKSSAVCISTVVLPLARYFTKLIPNENHEVVEEREEKILVEEKALSGDTEIKGIEDEALEENKKQILNVKFVVNDLKLLCKTQYLSESEMETKVNCIEVTLEDKKVTVVSSWIIVKISEVILNHKSFNICIQNNSTNIHLDDISLNLSLEDFRFFQNFSKSFISSSAPSQPKALQAPSKPAVNTNPTRIEYNFSIESFNFFINFENIITEISTQITVNYVSSPNSFKLQLADFYLTRGDFSIIKKIDLEIELHTGISTDINAYIRKTDNDIFISLEDLWYYLKFYTQVISQPSSSPPPPPPQIIETQNENKVTNFGLNFDTINLHFLTGSREKVFKFLLKYDGFEGKISQALEVNGEVSVAIEYFNNLLQTYEPFIEEVNFEFSFLQESAKEVYTQLGFKCNNKRPLEIIITDNMIKHLNGLYFGNIEKEAFGFSIYNGTGYTVMLFSTNGHTKEIRDQCVEEFQALKENENISCMLMIDEAYHPELIKIPLFCQEPMEHNLDSRTRILTEISFKNNRRFLRISSPYEIKNKTKLTFEISFYTSNESNEAEIVKTLNPQQKISFPLSCLNGVFSVIPPSTNIQDCRKIYIKTLSQDVPFTIKNGEFTLILYRSDRIIEIWPTFFIINYLPTYIFAKIDERGCENTIIVPMEKGEMYIPNDKVKALLLTVNGFNTCQKLKIFSKPLENVLQVKNSVFSLEIGMAQVKEPAYSISLYPLVLIVNYSLLPLEFHIIGKNSLPNISENYNENRILCGQVDSILAKYADKFSTPLNIKSEFKGNFQIEFAKDQKYELVYHVTTSKIPNEPVFTKIITIDSRILITNSMNRNIKIKQYLCEDNTFTYIKSKKTSCFNWNKNAERKLMHILVEGLSYDWCGCFSIDKETSFYIGIKNDQGKKFIRVDVKQQNDMTYIVFYDSIESDLKIINNTKKTIEFYQEDYVLPENVDPSETLYFAWYSQAGKHNLILQILEDSIRYNQKIEMIKIGELYKCNCGPSEQNCLFFKVSKEANTSVITISDTPPSSIGQNTINLSMTFESNQTFLSIVQEDIFKKKELVLISIQSLMLNLSKFKYSLDFQLSFMELQIDSQIFDYVICPIIFITEGSEHFMIKADVIISEKWICLEKVVVKPKNIVLNLDNNSMTSLLEFSKRFGTSSSMELDYYLNPNIEQEPSPGAYMYIDKINIIQFTLNFTFKVLPDSVKDHFKSYFLSFDKTIVYFEEYSQNSMYGSPGSLIFTISEFYKRNALDNIGNILKQNGMIGNALMFGLNLSKKMKRNKKPEQSTSRILTPNLSLSRAYYQKIVEDYKRDPSTRNTKLSHLTPIDISQYNAHKKQKVESVVDAISKPMSGLLGLFSNNKKKEEKLSETNNVIFKKRGARVFYGKLRLIRPYDPNDSMSVSFFTEKKIKYSNYIFYGQVILIRPIDFDMLMVAVFNEVIAIVNLSKAMIILKLRTAFMEKPYLDKEYIDFKGKNSKGKPIAYKLETVESDKMAELKVFICEMLKDLEISSN
ncbi:hypothetical protein SteCoe_21248 [Stentor coeruleus]|uniref:Chorein N-terminal domain-containing protein n=1 Tax=Stentor coeruleus TaxID=5963 RepID=A0A1R2BQ38_9CILI|nr:hypothetical protein SteCoe_21248 [Stentor coeruleus]